MRAAAPPISTSLHEPLRSTLQNNVTASRRPRGYLLLRLPFSTDNGSDNLPSTTGRLPGLRIDRDCFPRLALSSDFESLKAIRHQKHDPDNFSWAGDDLRADLIALPGISPGSASTAVRRSSVDLNDLSRLEAAERRSVARRLKRRRGPIPVRASPKKRRLGFPYLPKD